MIYHKSTGTRIALAAAACFMFGAQVVMGQAGRKLPQGKSAPPKSEPMPSPTPEPAKPAKPQFTLKVVRDIPQTLYLSFPFPEQMQEWAVGRLRRSPLLSVSAGNQSNHAEAVKLAKDETEAYVVWLQLEEDPMVKQEPSGRHAPAGQDRINFSLMAPVTGKTTYSGVVFLAQSNRGVGVRTNQSLCYPGVRNDDYLLLEASLEAAARIMEYLKVPVSPACP
jgi:hypothetical protein